MTSNEHYKKALTILREVEEAEAEAESIEVSIEALNLWNENIQRKLKIAEIHSRLALVRKDVY